MKRIRLNLSLMIPIRITLVGMAMAVPTIVIFWKSHGLSQTDIHVLEALFCIAMVICEVPSGYIADRLGRRRVMILSAGLLALGEGAYCIGESFVEFLLAEILLALGFALFSGADEALYYDSLKVLRRRGLFERLWGKVLFTEGIVAAAMCVGGGYLAAIDPRMPFIASMIGSLIMLGCCLFLVEPPRSRAPHDLSTRNPLREIISIGGLVWRDYQIRWLVVAPAIVLALAQCVVWLYQPYLQAVSVDIYWFGWIFAAFNVVTAISSATASRLRRLFGNRGLICLGFGMLVFGYVGMGFFLGPIGVGCFFAQQVVRGVFRVSFSGELNARVGSDYRATIISVKSLLNRLSYAVLLVPLGIAVDGFGLATSILGLAVLVSVVAPPILLSLPKALRG